MSIPILTSVHVGVDEVERAAEFLAQVTGSSAIIEGENTRIPVGDASILVHPLDASTKAGITGVSFFSDQGRKVTQLNGLNVVADLKVPSSVEADVSLDHVAIGVLDLEDSVGAWAARIGLEPEFVGIHPVSSGTLRVARFCLGDRMIELLSPVPGKPSAIRDRLERVGESPFAVALPAKNLQRKRLELEQSGIRLLWNEPHWLVHPNNPANVLIQLTPRVEH